MKGWIIYNGELAITKIVDLVYELEVKSVQMGLFLKLVKNNELAVTFLKDGSLCVQHINGEALPDYAVFWDKDIFLAKALERLGVRLFNPSSAIEWTDDKAKTFLKLSNYGIPMPKTLVAPFVYGKQKWTEEYFYFLEKELSYPMVVKERFGSFGMQVYKAENVSDMKRLLKNLQNREFLLQELIESSIGRDVRVILVGDQIVGSMLRTNAKDFRANITNGGTGTMVSLTKEQKDLALSAHKSLGLDFSGVDLLYGKDEKPILCEINSNVNYLSFEKLSKIGIAEKILAYIKKEMI